MYTPRARSFTFVSLLFLLLHVLVPAIALPVQPRPSFARSLDTPSFVQHNTVLLKRSHATLLDKSLSPADSSPDSAPIAHDPRTSSRVFARTFLDPHAIARTPPPSLLHGDTSTEYRVAPKLDRRWWLFDKIKQGVQGPSHPPPPPIAQDPRTSSRVFARTFIDPHAIARTPPPSLLHGDTSTEYRVAPKLDRRWWLFDKIKQGFQNFGKKVKEGFQNAGNKIKQGFQNFGNKVKQGFQKVKTAFQTAGTKIKQGFQNAGKKIKQGFQNFGNKVKQGFQKVKTAFQTAGKKIKEGFQTAGKKMKEGFQKAGKWIKENGAKVAKFGLKVISTAASVVGHVASFIPGLGKAVSKGLSVVSKVASFGSDKIHADLGAKLNKGMQVMDKIEHPIGGVAGKVFDAILKRDMSTWQKDA